MNIKFNKAISITLSIVTLIIYFSGMPLIDWLGKIFDSQKEQSLSLNSLYTANLTFLFMYSTNILIGGWFLFRARTFKQDNWTWLLIGLVYGYYSLLFFVLILIIQNIQTKRDFNATVTNILILIIVLYFIRISDDLFITRPLQNLLGYENYGIILKRTKELTYVSSAIMIIMNLIFAIKVLFWTKELNIRRKPIWIVSTLILGLFPVILLNELIILPNKNAA